jgi:hypothetical protein
MKRVLVIGAVVVAVLVVLGVAGSRSGKKDEEELRKVGAPATSCQPATDVPPTGASDHRNGEIAYDRVPPNSGPHAPNWLNVLKRRYTTSDAVPVEQVVHSLEHGWVVVWYDPAAPDLVVLDAALGAVDARKLVAVPYSRAPLPTPYVLAAWGHEQRCPAVSGEAIADFLKEHGGKNGDAPEPDAP